MPSLTQQLDVVVGIYRTDALAAAEAEADHKKAYAKTALEARHSGKAKSADEAKWIAESDDAVADLYSKRLITAAICDSTKQKINSLRAEIDYERSIMADRRAADAFHAHDPRTT